MGDEDQEKWDKQLKRKNDMYEDQWSEMQIDGQIEGLAVRQTQRQGWRAREE